MSKGKKRINIRKLKGRKGWFEIFCYECKKRIPVTGTKDLTPEQVFKNAGHYEEPVPFLKPNLGRSTRRHDNAMRAKLAKEAATGG